MANLRLALVDPSQLMFEQRRIIRFVRTASDAEYSEIKSALA